MPIPDKDPCVPSPCGPNSFCQVINQVPSCSCMDNYIGTPPNCRPECSINSDCPSNKACINNKCGDPCLGSCGLQTECHVYQHAAICSCLEGYTGNPFQSCHVKDKIGEDLHLVKYKFFLFAIVRDICMYPTQHL